jgi:tetratricopeptide (TPR) repeat protein
MPDRYTGRAHLDPADLERLADHPDETLPQTLEVALDHLARHCPTCRTVLDTYPRHQILDRAPTGQSAGTTAVAHAKRRIHDLAREREEAPALLAELLALPTLPRALATLTANPRFTTWGLASHLTDHAIDHLEDDPHGSHHHALLATATADSLPTDAYTPALRSTTRALARLALASTRLTAHHDLPAARRDIARAHEEAPNSSDRILVEIDLALARMRLDLATQDPQRARDAFGLIEPLTARHALAARHAQALLLLGRAHLGTGDLHGALGTFRVLRSITKANPDLDPLARWASVEAAGVLCTLHRPEEALTETDDLPRGADTTPRWRGTLARTRARALRAVGRTSEAQAALETARQDLATAGDSQAATHALLEALDLLLTEGRTADADHLLRKTQVSYPRDRAHHRPLFALYRLQVSAGQRTLTREAILEATNALRTSAGEDDVEPNGVH